MKKEYSDLKINILIFGAKDVLCASGDGWGDENVGGGDDWGNKDPSIF